LTRLVCNYILQAILKFLDIIITFGNYILQAILKFLDIIIRWILCWTYLGDIFNNTRPRRFRVAPKIIRNKEGYSDWFVYVNNPGPSGTVDQNVQGYILSDQGRPLVDLNSGAIRYVEVVTQGNVITGELKRKDGREGQFVTGQPFLYYAYKVMEIASHLWGDIFATAPGDNGTGTDFHKNLHTYNPNVQAWLAADGKLATNNYNAWTGKYTSPGSQDFFGDQSIPDMGERVDTDSTCSHPTNTFLHLIHGDIGFTPGNTAVAEDMTCGAGQTLNFDETNFLMLNKDDNGAAVTTYFVTEYNLDDSQVGCNDILGYTIVTFRGSQVPLFTAMKVLPFEADTNRMMSWIAENISGTNENIVRVAETYLHECGHQCGLLHDSDKPDCENDTTLHIAKVMNPDADVRRAYTRFQWCMVRLSWYMTRRSLTPFTQAPELPDSGSVPPPPPTPVGSP